MATRCRQMAGPVVAGLAAMLLASTGVGDVPRVSTTREVSAAEAEFVQICEEMYAETNRWAEFVARLTEFERAHHGTRAGLMAARHLVLLGFSGGAPGYPSSEPKYMGRRHALSVLKGYLDAPELPDVMRYLDGWFPEPETETFLRHVMNAPDASSHNRVFAKYMLAKWSLGIWENRRWCERRLSELDSGDTPPDPADQKVISVWLSLAPPSEKVAELKREAVEILESLSASSPDIRLPGVRGVVGGHLRYIVDVDPELTNAMPLVGDLAAGLLFKHQHLRVGRPAPELTLQLVDGRAWSLAEQRDKVVVIQFSFTGCGPCAAMYPLLGAMQEEYGEKLVILTIMCDERLAETLATIQSGKLTWNVYWDGSRPGPLATQWAVTGYPTVYVVGPDGRMAADAVHGGEQLRSKVAELIR